MKGGGGGGGGGTQTVTSKTELPDWINSAAQRNLGAAYNVSQNLLGPWTGPRVAGMTPGATADVAALQQQAGSANPAFNLAQGTTADLQGFSPLSVNPGQLATTDMSKYMSPYIKNVIDPTVAQMEQGRQTALNQIGDQAHATGAFGGSRQGVAEGVTNAQSNLLEDQLVGQLMNEGYTNAQGAAQNDIATNFAGQQANQNADLAGAGIRQGAANAGGNLAALGSNTFLQQLQAALAGQGVLQTQGQNQINADQAAYHEQQQFPIQQLQIPSSILSQTPYGQTTTQQTQLPGGNGLLQGMGAVASGAGILGGLFGANGAFPGALSGLFGMLSDETEKTDIKKLGKDPKTGVDLYAYRYKGDPKDYPKIVGPMAQDLEKKFPGSTRKVGGKLVVAPEVSSLFF
jgi:hypothetical protein